MNEIPDYIEDPAVGCFLIDKDFDIDKLKTKKDWIKAIKAGHVKPFIQKKND